MPPATSDVAYGMPGNTMSSDTAWGIDEASGNNAGSATPHSAISADASLNLHLERITNIDRRLSVGASRSALQASRISSGAARHITKLASSRPLGEQ